MTATWAPANAAISRKASPTARSIRTKAKSGLILQFEGPSGIPYLTHEELDAARQRLIADGGTFSKGVYTKILPDGRKINKDSHAACFEAITGKKMEFPEPRYDEADPDQAADVPAGLPIASLPASSISISARSANGAPACA